MPSLPAARVLLSIPFIFGGIHNLFAYSIFVDYLASRGIPIPNILAAPSIASDLVGGLLLVLGIRLRILVPFLMIYIVFMAFVGHPFWLFEDPKLREDMVFHFWKNIAIAGGLLAVSVSNTATCKTSDCALSKS